MPLLAWPIVIVVIALLAYDQYCLIQHAYLARRLEQEERDDLQG